MRKFKKEFGQHLKIIRENTKLTQEELAELLDYSVVNISRVENGHVFPSLEVILAYSKAFNLEVKDLFDFNTNIPHELPTELNRLIELLRETENRHTKLIYDISKRLLKELEP
jgi:transcriptional regulator with XRE-family HTH domain